MNVDFVFLCVVLVPVRRQWWDEARTHENRGHRVNKNVVWRLICKPRRVEARLREDKTHRTYSDVVQSIIYRQRWDEARPSEGRCHGTNSGIFNVPPNPQLQHIAKMRA